jgi:hypothetical protein
VKNRSSALNAALWLAVGAAAGALAGVMIADRSGGGSKLLRRLRTALKLYEGWQAIAATPAQRIPHGDVPYDADLDEDEHLEEGPVDDAREPRIDERVLTAFEQDPVLSECDIEIDEPEHGVIVLAGRVSSEEDVEHALTVAGGVPGVEHVENHVRVRRPRVMSSSPEESGA